MPRPKKRNFDIKLIEKQLLWGNKKNKICENHEGLTLFKLNKIIEENELLMKLDVTDDELKEILCMMITSEKSTWGFDYVNTIFRRWRIQVKQTQLKRVLRDLDPEASENRWQLNVDRIPQTYTAGPMHTWCLDAWCKLCIFGIWVYLIVDFATGFILDVTVMRNMRPESVWSSYHRALVVAHGASPLRVRIDAGAETVYIKIHHAFRLGLKKILIGKSVRNIVVERSHRYQVEKTGWWLRQCIEYLVEINLFDTENVIHKHSIYEIYGKCFQQKLNEWRENHNYRKRR